MSGWIKRVVDVREGEGLPLTQAFFTLFGLIAGHTILETARDALFLEKLPANRLAFVYALLAAIAFVSSTWNTRLVQRFGRRYALIITLLVAAYGTTILHFQPQTPANVFVLYLWSGFLGTVMVIQFWMFAGQLFNVAQGKRLFGQLAAGGVLGAVAGASTAAITLEFLPVHSLLLVSAGLFIATALLLTTVRTEDPKPNAIEPLATAKIATPATSSSNGTGTGAGTATATAKSAPAKPASFGLRALFREQPYLLRLAAIVVLSTAAVLTTDYLFKSVAANTLQGKALGTFFARYYAVLNAVSLIVQVGIAGRVVRQQGVLVAMMVLPFSLAFGAIGVLAFGGLLMLVLLTKGADGALRHSLHRVSSELTWMPVQPEARDRGKALIDGVIARGTQALVAALILALGMFDLTSPRVLASLVLAFTAGWIALAIGLRRPYLDLFRQALRRGTIDSTSLDELDLSSVEAVLEALSSRDPVRVIAAMDLLADKQRSRLIPGLILYHESDEVLVHALAILAKDKREDWFPLAERLLTHGSEEVRVAAVRAFATRARSDLVLKMIDDPSPKVRAHAAFCTAHCKDNETPLDDPLITDLLALEGDAGRTARIALLHAIRDHADTRFSDLVLMMIESGDPEVMEHAVETMSSVRDERFIPRLIARLGRREGRATIRHALVGLGEPALDALERALRDPNTDARVRLHIPRTISRFGTQRAADILVAQLAAETSGLVRYKVLRGLGRLAAEHTVTIDRAKIDARITENLVEHLRMLSVSVPLARAMPMVDAKARDSGALLLGLIEDKSRQALERAFRLLQIAHTREDIRSVYLALQSTDRRVRANAQEFLDVLATGEQDRRALFRIIADDLPADERVRRAADFLPRVPADHQEAISMLVRDSDEYLASLASYHALELGITALEAEVGAVYEARPSIRALFARVAAQSLNAHVPEPARG